MYITLLQRELDSKILLYLQHVYLYGNGDGRPYTRPLIQRHGAAAE